MSVRCSPVGEPAAPSKGEPGTTARPCLAAQSHGEEGDHHKTEHDHRKPHGTRTIPERDCLFSIRMFMQEVKLLHWILGPNAEQERCRPKTLSVNETQCSSGARRSLPALFP